MLAGALPQDGTDQVSGENWRRGIGRHLNETGKLPAALMDLEPAAPRVPALVPLAAVDKQFAKPRSGRSNHTATIRLLLPAVARPASKKDWTQVEFTVNVPVRYQRGLLRPPTLRISRDRALVRVDLPVEFPAVPKRPDNGRVLGLDWGVR